VNLYLYSPNTPSWRGAQLKKNTGTTLPLLIQFGRCALCASYIRKEDYQAVKH